MSTRKISENEALAKNLAEDYKRQLEAHISESSETVLHHAYELGRKAVAGGISVLDISILHHNALARALQTRPVETHDAVIAKASTFFSECLSPFEMLLRRYRDSNASLMAERKIIEGQMRQMQKMEALGRLTGGIAHDFNNLLGIIVSYIEVLTETAQDYQKDDIDTILTTALRGGELTRRLLAFARQQPLQPRIVNLNERLPETLKMLRPILGDTITIGMKLADDLWLTNIDPSQMEDALINLAINARDAMAGGGNIEIESANVHLDAQYASRNPEVTPGDYVMVAMSDTGSGMPPEVIERATEPFFTTKEPGKGTGLGLSMIYGFVRQSGGHLKIESKVGAGTTVRLYLPRSRNGFPAAARANAGVDPAAELRSVLLVDDNIVMRQLASWQLMQLGYKVQEAENAEDAIREFEMNGPFDLLLTDIGLPDGKSGYELAHRIRRIQPNIRILFTTGHAEPLDEKKYGDLAAVPVLRKPYRKQELIERVREAFASGRS
jgi:signal transduction histidine kinase